MKISFQDACSLQVTNIGEIGLISKQNLVSLIDLLTLYPPQAVSAYNPLILSLDLKSWQRFLGTLQYANGQFLLHPCNLRNCLVPGSDLLCNTSNKTLQLRILMFSFYIFTFSF